MKSQSSVDRHDMSPERLAALICLAVLVVTCLGAIIGYGAHSGSSQSSGAIPECQAEPQKARNVLEAQRGAEARRLLEDDLVKNKDADGLERLGITYESEDAIDNAERCWRKALSLDCNHALALLDLGRLALSQRRLDEAVSLLERAAELTPGSIDAVYDLSRAYRLSGDLVRAKQLDDRADLLRQSEPPRGGMRAP
jgi:tetratricopeptide (TPR) repeat protein